MIVKVNKEDNVPVNDVVLMAVVDARENLLHQNSTISFGEFATLQNFIEELTTFADPTSQILVMTSWLLRETYSVTR